MDVHPLIVPLFSLIAAAVLGLVVWLVRTVGDLRSILIGADGRNGLRGDMREVRSDLKELHGARHLLNDSLQVAVGKLSLVDHRVATVERKLDDDVKRICRDVEGLRTDLRDARDDWDGTERRRGRRTDDG